MNSSVLRLGNCSKTHEGILGEEHNWITCANKLIKLHVLDQACELKAIQEEGSLANFKSHIGNVGQPLPLSGGRCAAKTPFRVGVQKLTHATEK
jgi:hypothetical protein